MQPRGEKSLYPMAKWSVEPWQGGEEKQAWLRARGSRLVGGPLSRPLLLSVAGNTKGKRVGWEGLAPLPAEVSPLASNDYCV